MADQVPTGLTPDEGSFQPIGNVSSGANPQPTAGLTGDDSTFQPIAGAQPQEQDSSQPQSFQTPSGQTYQVGQSVQHSTGVYGEVTGQHSGTGNAVVKWHQGADQFKPGMLVNVDGHSGVVAGKSNNGKVLVDWGSKGISSVSPGDIDAPTGVGSFVAGVGNSLAKTVAGASKMLGVHSQGLDESQRQINDSTAVNPASGKAGELAGDLVQFLAANGAVKAGTGMVSALEVPEQYKVAATITKALADHPALAKILHAGINGAITGGTLGGVQSGGNLGSAAEGAAAGGLMEAGGEALPGIVKAGASKVGDLINRGGKAAADFVQDAPNLPGKLWPDKIDVPTQQAFRDSLQPIHDQQVQKIADAIGKSVQDEGVKPPVVNDIRKMPKLAADALKQEASHDYSQVDEAIEKATGQQGKYQATDEEITNLQRQLRENSGDKEKAVKINESLNEQKALKAVQMQAIKDAGLEDVAARASRLTKKANALTDFHDKLLGTARTKGGTNLQINPDNFLTQLHNLDNDTTYGADGRLAQAFGQHGKDLIKGTEDSAVALRKAGDAHAELKRQAAEIMRTRKLTRNVAVGTGILGGGDIIRHVVQ